jgi:hypothetical protein
MKTQLILSAAVLALAACGSSGGDNGSAGNGETVAGATDSATGGSGAAPAAAGQSGPAASGVSLQPGEWEIKMEVLDVKVEGLPPGLGESMKSQAGGTNRTCMTPEDAKGPKGDIFTGDKTGNCKSEGFKWADGRINGKTVCPGQGGTGEMVMTMAGSYSPQSLDMTMETRTGMMGKPMTMKMRVSGHRVGECTAATKKG